MKQMPRTHVEYIELGHVHVGDWYVAQMVIAAGNNFHVSFAKEPYKKDYILQK